MSLFQLRHHSRMLADQQRLEAFRLAINALITPESHVVDLGCGTGVLGSMALKAGAKKLDAIEYFAANAKFAQGMLSAYTDKARVHCARSFDVVVDGEPDILVSETIGLLGPEENTVEALYDFARRHSSLRAIVPCELSVCAQWIRSDFLDSQYQDLLDPLFACGGGELPTEFCLRVLDEEAAKEMLTLDHSKHLWASVGEEMILRTYRLGTDFDSSFSKAIQVPEQDGSPLFLHLFFRAQLTPCIELNSHCGSPVTHWLHSFVRPPQLEPASALRIAFRPGSGSVDFEWLTGSGNSNANEA